MNAPQKMSPRGRLQELLAIVESQRTDAQWDEIHELEIELSSANREQPLNQVPSRATPRQLPAVNPGLVAARGRRSRSRRPTRGDPSRNRRDAWPSAEPLMFGVSLVW